MQASANYLVFFYVFIEICRLESQLLEEPLVVTGQVLVIEDLANGLLGILTLGGLIKGF